LEQARYFRSMLRIQHGQAEAVVAEMTETLARKQPQFYARAAGLTGMIASPQIGPLLAAFLVSPRAPLTRMDWYQALALRSQAWEKLGDRERAEADRKLAMEIINELIRNAPRQPYQP